MLIKDSELVVVVDQPRTVLECPGLDVDLTSNVMRASLLPILSAVAHSTNILDCFFPSAVALMLLVSCGANLRLQVQSRSGLLRHLEDLQATYPSIFLRAS